MNYYLFTYSGHGLPIALRLQQEGHSVLVGQVQEKRDVLSKIEQNAAAEDPRAKARRLSLYDGLLEKVSAEKLVEHLRTVQDTENSFVIFDINNLFKYAQQVAELGFPGNYPTEEDVILEVDRAAAKQFAAERYPHLRVAQTHEFSTVEQGVRFLESTDELWVLKGKDDQARVVVPDVQDSQLARGQLLEALKTQREAYESAGYILELLIPSLIELTPEKTYWDGVPVATVLDIENKPMGAGNIGPQTGCAQDLVFATDLEDKINQIAFPPFVDELARQHKGLFIWDASILIDGKTGKMYFGEYCPNRFGYNCLMTQIALAGSAHKFFSSLRQGKSPYPTNQVSTSVRLFNYRQESDGMPLAGSRIEYADKIEDSLWLWDVRHEKGKRVSVGLDKNVGVLTGKGRSVLEASKRMYRANDAFSFEGAYFRPQFDYVSREYSTSLVNRLRYGLEKGLYRIGFGID
jgi:hypothetical protein